MADKTEVITTIRNYTRIIANADEDTVVHQESLGKHAFVELKEPFKEIKTVAAILNECDLARCPTEILDKLLNMLKELSNLAEGLKKFEGGTNGNQKRGLINDFNSSAYQVYQAAIPILAMNAVPTPDQKTSQLATVEAEKKLILAGIQQEWDSAKASAKSAEESRKVAENAATAAKELAEKVGVSDEKGHFQGLSQSHKVLARIWLGLSIAAAAIIFVMAWYHFYHPYNITPSGKWIVWQQIISKTILISILSFFLVFAVRNYNTSRHNHVVNEHRAKALATFETFVSNTKSDETRDAVLLQSCKAVFGHQTSGYLRKDPETSGLPLVDFLKPLAGK